MNSESLFTKCNSCGKEVSISVRRCPNCGGKIKKIGIIHWVGIIIVVLFIIGIINSPETLNGHEKKVVNPQTIKEKAMSGVTLDYTWKKKGFGTVMEADLLIKNNSVYDIKDIQIQCDHYAKSGTKIDSNSRTIYEIINATTSKTVSNFNMGFINDQADTSTCFVNNFALLNH